ncbi:hypothetical protein ACGFIE_00485 [Micromonospora sp. NPDC049275]|uniref:hypothetical protein n=1 Tax=Micromonospora sp. NPDC049275 TaxID=3364268 RepID=UPI003713B5C4
MISELIRTHTGHTIADDTLAAARTRGGSLAATASAITDACHALLATEADLATSVDAISGHLSQIRRAVTGGPSTSYVTRHRLVALQQLGPRCDGLTAQWASQITHLRAVVRIWLAHQSQQGAPSDSTIEDFANGIIILIDNDISEGVLPLGVGSFSDLHSYLDANDYLYAEGVPYGTEAASEITVAVQDLVEARLRTTGRPFCTYGACTFADHDHTTLHSPDGADLPAIQPMHCQHCGRPAHYDSRLDDYRHDDPAAPDCFLIHRA